MAADQTPVSGELTPAAEPSPTPDASPFSLLIGTIIRPAATFTRLRDVKRGYWWFALVVTIVAILAVSAASASVTSARLAQFTSGRGNFTTLGQGNLNSSTTGANPATGATGATGSTGQRNNGGTGQRNQQGGTGANFTGTRTFAAPSPLLLIGLPVLGGVAVTLLDYLLRAFVVFLGSMVLGGKAAFREVFRMAAWTTIPAAVRGIVQAASVVLTSGQVAAGFSAALTAAEIRSLPILNLMLSYVDIYTLWSALLLGIGAVITGKLSKGKAAFTVAIYLGVSLVGILLFYSVTSAIGGALGGGTNRGGLGIPGTGGGGTRIGRPGG